MSANNTECGECGEVSQKGYIGTSRSDNKTILCPICEQNEALAELAEDEAAKRQIQKMNPKCVVCGVNWVDVFNGFDTCEECIKRA